MRIHEAFLRIVALCLALGAAGPALAEPGDVIWSLDLPGGVATYGSPALSPNGTIYIGTADPPNEANLTAVSPDGRKEWSIKLGKMAMNSAPAVSPNGTIYIGTCGGGETNLTAVSPGGVREWTTSLGSGNSIYSSPALSPNGTIYIGAYDGGSGAGNLSAISPDGIKQWSIKVCGSLLYSSAAVSPNGTIYIGVDGAGGGNLTAVSPDGGKDWSIKLGDAPMYSSPSVTSNGTIYIGAYGSGEGNLTAVSPDGSMEWTVQLGISSELHSTPVVSSNGTIYIGATVTPSMGSLTAVSPDGTMEWSIKVASSALYSSPAVSANGAIYIEGYGAGQGNLTAVSLDGTREWTANIGASVVYASPAIAPDGTVYAVDVDGLLTAFEGDGSGLMNSAWPKFQQNSRSTGRYEFGVEVAPDQEQGVEVTLIQANSTTITAQALDATYRIGGLPVSQKKGFSAKISPDGAVGKFRFGVSGVNVASSNQTLYKLFADGSVLKFGDYASPGSGASDGSWWITDANDEYVEEGAKLEKDAIYYVEFCVQDNGGYDLSSTAGVIVDPCVLTQGSSSSSSSSSSGCVLNPDAGFSLECLLLVLAAPLWIVRWRRGRS